MREYFKNIFKEVVRESLKETFFIICHRAPTEYDTDYPVNAIWKHGKDIYRLTNLKAKWVKEE